MSSPRTIMRRISLTCLSGTYPKPERSPRTKYATFVSLAAMGLVLVFLTSTMAYAQTPAGPNRPAGVPDGYVITPSGYYHPSCVRRLAKGETLLDGGRVLQHANGTIEDTPTCNYPRYRANGDIVVAGEAHSQPQLINGWVEETYTTTTTSSSFAYLVATWTVPPAPNSNGQIIFFFPGLQDYADNVSILQPVLGWNKDFAEAWSIASWNASSPSGINYESTPVLVNPGDTIQGTVWSTCSVGTLTCPTWDVTIFDESTGIHTALVNTPNESQTFNWASAGVLEVYNFSQCSDYPPNGGITFSNVELYDYNFNLISNPNWAFYVYTGLTPKCDYSGNVAATQVSLDYTKPPTVTSFTIAPSTTVIVGTTLSATIVGIAGSNPLSSASLLRTADLTGATGWTTVSGVSVAGSSVDVTLGDTPPAGTYLYGAHITDDTGEFGTEPSTIRVTVNSAPTITVFNATPSTVNGGATITYSVTLSAAAPSGGATVSCNSSATSVIPNTAVTIPAGSASGQTTVVAQNPSSTTQVTVTASYGTSSKQQAITVNPVIPTVTTGSATLVTSSSATLGGTVNANGVDTYVWLQYATNSSMSGAKATPEQNIGYGTSTVPFSANITGLSANTTYYYQAVANNGAAVSLGSILSFTTLSSGPVLSTFAISPSTIYSGGTATLTLGLSGTTSSTATISLVSNNPSAFPVPPTTNIQAGQSMTSFGDQAGTVTVSTPVVVTATYNGISLQAQVTVNPTPSITAFSATPSTVNGGATITYSVTLSGAAPSGGATVSCNSSATSVIPNTTVTILGGATGGQTTVVTQNPSSTTQVTVTASYGGSSQQQTITVNPLPTYTISGQVTVSSSGLAGVTILLSGGASASTTTNSSGYYSFSGLAGGLNYAVTPSLSGYTFSPPSQGFNALNANQTASFTATSVAPVVNLSASSLSFANEILGTTSAAQAVTMTNTGTGTLLNINVSTTGDFAQTNNCGSSLGAGLSCTISVTFTPTVVGTRNGSVLISDNAAGSPQAVTLTGNGVVAVAISPSSLSFTPQLVKTTSAIQTVTLTNYQAVPVNVGSISISGPFSETDNCADTQVAAGGACSISVAFTPTVNGATAGSLIVTDNGPGSSPTVQLAGTGSGTVVNGFVGVSSMGIPRAQHAATLLPTGNVLITGGAPTAAAQLYNPATTSFTPTVNNMSTPRTWHMSREIASGNVLVLGGVDANGNYLASADLYDYTTNIFSPTGSMSTPRAMPTATWLPSTGMLLVTGGLSASDSTGPLASAELYNPASGTFSLTGNMYTPRYNHAASILQDGTVLVTGGRCDPSPNCASDVGISAEIYNPITGSFTRIGNMNVSRVLHTATPLYDGTVLITGGFAGTVDTAEIYNPATQTFTPTATEMIGGSVVEHRATPLHTNSNSPYQVLITGGNDTAEAQLYDPPTQTFTATSSMTTPRSFHTVTPVKGGLIVTGGSDEPCEGVLGNCSQQWASAELYTVQTVSVTLTSSMNPSYLNESVTFTAVVNGDGAVPTGSVTFKEGSTTVGTVALASGQASFTATFTTKESVSITASYSGDQNYKATNSNVIKQVVQQYTTSTALVSSVNPSAYGEAVTLSATVSSAGPTPTGTVTFKNGSAALGSAALSGGVAKITKSTLPVATSTITASYGGDTTDAKSASSALEQVVEKATSTTAVVSSLNPSTAGKTVTFTATVTSPTTKPTGTVTFMDGTSELGSKTLASGKVSYSTKALSAGSHNITVVYEGTAGISGSTSPVLVETVN